FARNQREYHEPRRYRDRGGGDGGLLDRDGGERARAAGGGAVEEWRDGFRGAADCDSFGGGAGSGAGAVFQFAGDYGEFFAGVFARGSGRENVSAAGVYEDIRDGRGVGFGGDVDSGFDGVFLAGGNVAGEMVAVGANGGLRGGHFSKGIGGVVWVVWRGADERR